MTRYSSRAAWGCFVRCRAGEHFWLPRRGDAVETVGLIPHRFGSHRNDEITGLAIDASTERVYAAGTTMGAVGGEHRGFGDVWMAVVVPTAGVSGDVWTSYHHISVTDEQLLTVRELHGVKVKALSARVR